MEDQETPTVIIIDSGESETEKIKRIEKATVFTVIVVAIGCFIAGVVVGKSS